VSAFERSYVLGLRAGEGAALMPEQFALHEIGRHSAAVEHDERFADTRAVIVQQMSEYVLSGTGFARQRHRDVCRSQPAHDGENIMHRPR
jgi:hypothetical protein